ncbi:short chain dehydrogenase sol3 [Diplogelasinospora grovesii]|uniref:Short chain dehydrogenase sol3 n=1 Tax=Diplogelasinospora grovesii TaxID=303347 RepID=A0AAN6MWG1_9PEZI|nr:short chain dehydrogenase sol3 [Diplogelasinospora grovesii]
MSATSALHGAASTIFSNLFVKLPYPDGDSLRGQTVIVTGSNQGLGFEASKHLVRLGVERLIMGVRSIEKGEAARREMLQQSGAKTTIDVWQVDLESYESVKAFANRASTLPRLDAILANAGIMTTEFNKAEGNERTLTVNVISTFLLCLLLVPKMRESASQFHATPRIVIPNSALHYMAPLKEVEPNNSLTIFDRLSDPKTADMGNRYPLSKLLVIYVVRELAGLLNKQGKMGVIINTPNPSFCKSQLAREMAGLGMRVAERMLARSTEEGSRALVHGLMAGPESSGQYLTNCHVQAPSSSVTSQKGQGIQKRVFDELVQKLEKISPGLMASL